MSNPSKKTAVKHPSPKSSTRTYAEIKEAARHRSALASTSGRDIGEIPKVFNELRRESCRHNLKLYLKTYYPMSFPLDWSQDHLLVIGKIETAILHGGLFALAMPRGEGKTTICEHAALWATFYGYRSFVTLVGASEDAAQESMEVIKSEIECNELLLEDFPEICYPIRALEGIANRCAGQLCNGQRTRISWSTEIVLPTVSGSLASGSAIKAVGITGRVRGMKVTRADGSSIRPNFVLIDDPQTDESAGSPEQNRKRLKVVSGAILGLPGPGVKISAVMPCTVIRPNDMADQLLNRDKHPEWNGERCKLLREFPSNTELWNRYREIWADSLRQYGDIRDATEFYADHRSEMDEGAESSWPERYETGELSAIQYAMNLYIRDPETFYAEYQNEPMPEDGGESDKIAIQNVWDRMNNRPRGEVPTSADHLTMFIDVQKNLMFWIICAFAENFTSWVIDYGSFPDQKRRYFSLHDANPTYSQQYPGAGLEGSIYSALKELTDDYLSRSFAREDGAEMRIERCMIDSGWGRSTQTVYQFCRESVHAAVLLPSKGMGITAAQRPMTEYRKNQGDRIGFNWMIPRSVRKVSARYVLYDTNFWKSFFRERLLSAQGDPGSLTLFGNDVERHRLLAEHWASEISEPTSGRGRKVDIWKMLPGRDNHWLDGVVGCMVGASISGVTLQSSEIGHTLISHSRRESSPSGGRRFTPGQSSAPGRRFTPR